MLRSALTIASRDLHVFPCLPRDKRPATARGCLDATTDAETIRAWWRQEPQYNIAIATGRLSKVFAIDVDGVDAEAELRKLEAAHGALPATVEVITARGRHLYFQMPDSPLRNSAGKIAPGLDIRATGGYTLAPPSIHPSGRTYAWSVDSARTFAEAPPWLLAKITEPTAGNGKAPTPPSQWRTLMADGVDEGQRDNAAARLAGYLLRHGIDVIVVLETLRLWNAERCRPPLPAQDIERIVNSIAGRELKRRGHG
jgi:hypothetical protein